MSVEYETCPHCQARTFKCAICKKRFHSTCNDVETLEEMQRRFGDLPAEERVVICDDCNQWATEKMKELGLL